MATIIARPSANGKTAYRAEIRRKGYPKQVKTFSLKRDAVKWARKIEREIDAGTWRDLHDASELLLTDALGRYLREVSVKKRPGSQKRDQLSASHLETRLGKLSLAQLVSSVLTDYRDSRLKIVSANSVGLELALLSHLFNTARKEWGIRIDNPVSDIKKPKIPESRSPILSQEQLQKFLAICKQSGSSLLYPFVVLALHTGARSFEIRSLQWNQVNLTDAYILITSEVSKNHRTRHVPMTPAVYSVFLQLKQNSNDSSSVAEGNNLIFPSRSNPENPRDIHKAFDSAVVKAGLDKLPGIGKLRIHDLRHCCGSALIMAGVDLETVRKILGHRDISTTQKYLHVVDKHMSQSIKKIGNLGIPKTTEKS